MPLSKYLMTREQYDADCRDRLEEAHPSDPAAVARVMARRYPKSTEQAAEELKRRGLRIDADQLSRRVTQEFRQIGRNFVWFADDIDAVAEDLDQANRLTYDAHYRREQGLSFAEHAAVQKQVRTKRLAIMQQVADAAGGTIPDVADACNRVMPDPLEWDEAAIAKAVSLTREYIASQGVAR
ncbi:MAG: hypothetical protein HUU19_10315 [Phycisphaerales bacterium]|nr:hypothetical protein [Phycisphaerales bacterium]